MPEAAAQTGPEFSAVFEKSRRPMYVLDARTLRFLAVNDAALSFYGYSRPKFLRLSLFDLRRDHGKQAARNVRSHGLGLPWVGEARHYTKAGARVDVRVWAFPGRHQGRDAWVSTVLPLPLLARVERARLPESPDLTEASQLPLLFQTNPQPMWVFDVRTLRFLAVNDAARKLYGYSSAQWRRLTMVSVRPKEDAKEFLKTVRRDARRGAYHAGVWRHLRRDGSVMHVDVRAIDVSFNGRRARLAVLTDVTEARRSESKSAHAERLLASVVNNAPVILFANDARGVITLSEGRGLEGLGLKPGQTVGVNVFRGPRANPALAAATRRALRGETFVADVPVGERLFQTSYTPLRGADGRVQGTVGVATDVTEMRRSEQRRHAAEQRLASVTASAPIILFAVDRSGVFTLSTGRGLAGLGLKPGQFVGQSLFKVYRGHPQIVADARRALRGEAFATVAEVQGRFYRTAWTPLRGRAGRNEGAIGVATDVTDSVRLERDLRASEERYRELYSKTPAMLHSIDREGRIVSASDRWLKTLGYRRDEVIGKRSVDFLTPASRKFAREKVLPEFYKTGVTVEAPYEMVKKNGEVIDVLLSATAHREPGGGVDRSLAVITDVTERKRDQDKILEIISLQEATLESTADGLLVVDRYGRVASFNRKFAELWRMPEELQVSKDDRRMLAWARAQLKENSSFMTRVRELYGKPESESFDLLELKDGRVFERYSRPQRLGGRVVGRVWSFRDVTERRRLEREIAETSAREQAKIGRDLHDSIGQTLTAVSLGLKALQRGPDGRRESPEVIRLEALTRLAIQQVRDVARGLLPHELQAGDVGASLRALSAGARKMFGVPCQVAIRGDTKLGDNATAVQLYRIAQEALNNAAKHARSGEGVRISFDAGERSLRLVVRDHGVGIPPSGRRGDSPGLGIKIMRHRAEILGGRLSVGRAPGGGTEVVCECPRPGGKP